jgi:hypothetical protein
MYIDEVVCTDMEGINLVLGAALSQVFVDMGHNQTVPPSVKTFVTCCKLLQIKVQTKKMSKQNLNRLCLEG